MLDRIFNPENRFWSFLNKVVDALFLGVLWGVASIPIITVGAATTALYQFTLKQTDDEEGYVWRSYWKAFRKNFLQATVLWVVVLAAGAFVAIDIYACMTISAPVPIRVLCFALVLGLTFVYVLSALYVFPILSRFDLPIRKILTNSVVMAMGNLYVSITVLVIYAIFLMISWRALLLFPIFMSLAAFFSSYLFRHVFSRYWDDDEDAV
ncbi:MAG: YesL family protein [Brotaphodocola sp.]